MSEATKPDAPAAEAYDPAKDSAVAYAREAARDPNFSADFIDQKWRRTGDLNAIDAAYGGLRG
jgi:hypothetical protein